LFPLGLHRHRLVELHQRINIVFVCKPYLHERLS
jgi:hypothetical protein